jgi:VanZ family protein
MADSTSPISSTRSAWRWTVWCVFCVLWTTALLVPDPDALVRAILFGHADGEAVLRAFDQHVTAFSKALHVGAYAVFVILSGWVRAPFRTRVILVLFISAHAMATEALQQFVPGRHPSLRDVGLDHLGMLIGLFLSWKRWVWKS